MSLAPAGGEFTNMLKTKFAKTNSSLIASVVFFSVPGVCYSRPQESVQHPGDQPALHTYQSTLNLLFPRARPNFRETDYRIFLRFRPSFAPESQVVISRLTDGTIEVVSYSLPDERTTVKDHIDTLVMRGIEDPVQLAKHIKVKRAQVGLSSGALEQLMETYSQLRISPSLDTRIALDPTMYELWYEATGNQLYISLAGPDYTYAPKADPVIRWMNEVRLAVLHAQQTLQ